MRSCCPTLLFYCCDKISWTKAIKGGMGFPSCDVHITSHYRGKSVQTLRAGTWRLGWKQRPWKKTIYWLDTHGFLDLFSYSIQDDWPRDGICYSVTSPPTSTTYPESVPYAYLQANMREATPQLQIPFSPHRYVTFTNTAHHTF